MCRRWRAAREWCRRWSCSGGKNWTWHFLARLKHKAVHNCSLMSWCGFVCRHLKTALHGWRFQLKIEDYFLIHLELRGSDHDESSQDDLPLPPSDLRITARPNWAPPTTLQTSLANTMPSFFTNPIPQTGLTAEMSVRRARTSQSSQLCNFMKLPVASFESVSHGSSVAWSIIHHICLT